MSFFFGISSSKESFCRWPNSHVFPKACLVVLALTRLSYRQGLEFMVIAKS